MALPGFEPILLTVKDRQGSVRGLEIPHDAQYNLMEVLKTFDYKMRATCGGMGLCADCHCHILEGMDNLPEPTFQELDTLDVLPTASSRSRLACQIAPGAHLHGVYLELQGNDHY